MSEVPKTLEEARDRNILRMQEVMNRYPGGIDAFLTKMEKIADTMSHSMQDCLWNLEFERERQTEGPIQG